MSTGKKTSHFPSKRKRHDPFSDLISNIDQLFNGKPVGGVLQSMDQFFTNSSMNRSFPIEMTEEQDCYIIKAKLPGIKQQQINIEAYNQSLIITVQQYEKTQHKGANGQTISQKQSTHSISRNVTFVKPIDDQHISAQHIDGLLEIKVPKRRGKEVPFIKH